MTNNVDSLPIENKRARLQFTLAELLLFVAMTFLGMALYEPTVNKDSRILACLVVILGTGVGALIGLIACSSGCSNRKMWFIGGILTGWMLTFWIAVITHSVSTGWHERAFKVVLLGLPLFVLLGYTIRLRSRVDGSRNVPQLPLFLVSIAMYGEILISVAPSLLLRRYACSCGGPSWDCRAFAEAQEVYHRTDYSETGIQYATSLNILWGDKGKLSLIDSSLAHAEIGGSKMQPKAGYYFKVLTAQGPSAPGGRRSYIDASGKMTLGYALIAIPSKYTETGRVCYIINQNGTIFERDLGPNTPFVAAATTEFDPDTNWVPTQ